MSNSKEQNGRQPSQKTTPPTDPRLRNVSAPEVCRDFIWGICLKGAQCRHPHVRDFESMKETLKFCHDYQNKTGCIRPDCTYLHATREEQNLFLTTGQIPRVLTERYAAISNPVNTMPEAMAQNMLYMGEFLHQPPPPPPVPMAPPVTATIPPPIPRPPLPPLPSLLAPPPPPPPPTETTTPMRITPPKYTCTTTQSTPVVMCNPLNQPPLPLPPNFDASKPPPPLPPQANGAQKRLAEPCEAGPSKARKADPSKGIDLCDSCVQRKLRLELYRQEIQKLQCEKEYKTLLYEKKLEDYENGRLLLRSIVNPELYQILDEYVERPAASIPAQDILSQLGHSFGMGHSSVSTEDTILLSLSAPSRTRPSTINSTSPDLLQTVLELIRTTTTTSGPDRSPMSDASRPSTSSHIVTNTEPHRMNGLHSLLNGQRVERPPHEVVVPRFPPSPTAYQPTVPPPTVRPFYATPYPATATATATASSISTAISSTNPPFNQSIRIAAPQMAARPTLSVTTPNTTTNMQNFNQCMLGQFPPQPPFYPPYQ